MKTKLCPHCQETKDVSEFYKRSKQFSTLSSWCKKCTSNKINENYHYRIKEDDEESWPVPEQPNTYYNQCQCDSVHNILNALEWKWSEFKQIWYKDGIKDKDGNWNFQKK